MKSSSKNGTKQDYSTISFVFNEEIENETVPLSEKITFYSNPWSWKLSNIFSSSTS